MAKTKRTKITDYTFDEENINRGTARGDQMLEKSLTEVGIGRSVLADKNGKFIAGNKTAAKAIELGITKVLEVESDGTELIVVKRTDLDITTEKGIKAKILDNSVSKTNYVENAKVSAAMATAADITDYSAYGLTERAMIDRNVDFKPKPAMFRKLEMYYVTLFRAREKKGSNLEDFKRDQLNAQKLATHAADFIRSFYPMPTDTCILTTPRRSHAAKNGFHFASELCKFASEILGLPFHEGAFEARTKQKIEPDIKLTREIPQSTVILLDDIVTTGSTILACRRLLPTKNVFAISMINNN